MDLALVQQFKQVQAGHVMEEVNDELWNQLEKFNVSKLLEPYLSAVVSMVVLV